MTDGRNEEPEKLRAAWDAVQSAVRQFNAKIPIEARCPFCENPLGVDGMPKESPTQWMIHCACGKSNTTLKGL
jgi:hypothetical protein